MDTSVRRPTTTRLSKAIVTTILCLLISTTATSDGKELCHPQDKKALLEIANSPLGPFPSWTADTDCCHPHWYGARCDSTHRVVSILIWYDNRSTGPIPPSIGDLPFLQDLTIRKLPNLSGTIPSAITNLKNLHSIRFDSNNLSGPVPSFFHRMTNLYMLDLSFNRFSGSIPPELGRAPSLMSLDISRNLLTGPIPESFGHFKISGKIDMWGTSMYLILSHNQLSGPIPRSMGNINFTTLYLSRNQLTGDASFLFGKDKPLQLMDLSRNKLSFNFSTVEIPTGLTSLDLNHNQIFGGFPTTGMENVWQFLNVSYNRLCGPIPNVGSHASSDQTEYFHNKCLCGPPLAACKS